MCCGLQRMVGRVKRCSVFPVALSHRPGRRRLNEFRAARSSGHRLAASMRDVLLQAPQERLDQLGASGPAAAEQASHVAGPTLAIHRLIRL